MSRPKRSALHRTSTPRAGSRVANERASRNRHARCVSESFLRGAIAKGGRARRPRAIDRCYLESRETERGYDTERSSRSTGARARRDRPKPPRRAYSSSPRCLLCDSHAVRSRRLTGSASCNSAVTSPSRTAGREKRDRRRPRSPAPPPSRHARASRSGAHVFPIESRDVFACSRQPSRDARAIDFRSARSRHGLRFARAFPPGAVSKPIPPRVRASANARRDATRPAIPRATLVTIPAPSSDQPQTRRILLSRSWAPPTDPRRGASHRGTSEPIREQTRFRAVASDSASASPRPPSPTPASRTDEHPRHHWQRRRPTSPFAGTAADRSAPTRTKAGAAWSAEAIALGYEAGTIKKRLRPPRAIWGGRDDRRRHRRRRHEARVRHIVDSFAGDGDEHATSRRRRRVSLSGCSPGSGCMLTRRRFPSRVSSTDCTAGACKTPNNSVTAALSQGHHVRAHRALHVRASLHAEGGGGSIPQPRRRAGPSTAAAWGDRTAAAG